MLDIKYYSRDVFNAMLKHGWWYHQFNGEHIDGGEFCINFQRYDASVALSHFPTENECYIYIDFYLSGEHRDDVSVQVDEMVKDELRIDYLLDKPVDLINRIHTEYKGKSDIHLGLDKSSAEDVVVRLLTNMDKATKTIRDFHEKPNHKLLPEFAKEVGKRFESSGYDIEVTVAKRERFKNVIGCDSERVCMAFTKDKMKFYYFFALSQVLFDLEHYHSECFIDDEQGMDFYDSDWLKYGSDACKLELKKIIEDNSVNLMLDMIAHTDVFSVNYDI